MRCKCGYNFFDHALDKPRPYASFLIVNDNDYPKFLRSEMKAVAHKRAKDKQAALRAIANSCKYAGTLNVCPNCSLLSIYTPPADKITYFSPLPESSQPVR